MYQVELLFGKLVLTSPVGIAHGKAVKNLTQHFYSRFPTSEYTIGVQDPITLVDDSEPEPDLFIAKGSLKAYDHHPYTEDLMLVVEVSDTTLPKDRNTKKVSYATAGIIEYWIINVFDRQLERYTEPDTDTREYGRKQVFMSGDNFNSDALGEFAVAELLDY